MIIANRLASLVLILWLLRHRVHAATHHVHHRDSSLQDPRQRVRLYELHRRRRPDLQPVCQPRGAGEAWVEVLSLVSIVSPKRGTEI